MACDHFRIEDSGGDTIEMYLTSTNYGTVTPLGGIIELSNDSKQIAKSRGGKV